MHVRIAWEIYNHQQKQKPSQSSKVPATSLSKRNDGPKSHPQPKADPLLRPPNPPSNPPANPPMLGLPRPPMQSPDPYGIMRAPFPPPIYGAAPLGQ